MPSAKPRQAHPARQPYYCDECGVVIFEVCGDLLVVKARHHGALHVSCISITELYNRTRQPSE